MRWRRRVYARSQPACEWPEVRSVFPYGGVRRYNYPRGRVLWMTRSWHAEEQPLRLAAGDSWSYSLRFTAPGGSGRRAPPGLTRSRIGFGLPAATA